MDPSKPTADCLRDPIVLLATGLGTGLLPKAPGTWGTLLAVPIAWAVGGLEAWFGLGLAVALVIVGVPICGYAGRKLGDPDDPAIVWDEVAAYLCLTPIMGQNWLLILAGFLAFRAFDIVKPWPIREVDHRLKGGAGTMLDDLLAAAYSALCLLLLQQLVF